MDMYYSHLKRDTSRTQRTPRSPLCAQPLGKTIITDSIPPREACFTPREHCHTHQQYSTTSKKWTTTAQTPGNPTKVTQPPSHPQTKEERNRTHSPKQPDNHETKRKSNKKIGRHVRLPDIAPIPRPLSPKDSTFYEYRLIFNHIKLRSLQQMATQELLPLPHIFKKTRPSYRAQGAPTSNNARNHAPRPNTDTP